jgi:type IV secretory pathway VirB6-like protein
MTLETINSVFLAVGLALAGAYLFNMLRIRQLEREIAAEETETARMATAMAESARGSAGKKTTPTARSKTVARARRKAP